MQRGVKLGYTVESRRAGQGYGFLETAPRRQEADNEGWWPAYTAWQAFAAKVLAEGGRNVDSYLTRLTATRTRCPVRPGLLQDAMAAAGEKGERPKKMPTTPSSPKAAVPMWRSWTTCT